MPDRQEKILSKLWYSTETFFKINNHNFYLNIAYGAVYIFNPFAPGVFAEKCVLKLVEWFSGHCHAIKS